ncbi:mechanosensitive ion channel family protein [Actinomadura craniellae]|uniref:Mechanosensitive ion channel family protein n=1 Tax=Actinomadura craniellae TaxID=2231787 RepID=A0A365HC07_9ACTN|nr:mechanosensitive ion channel family protein [Actinomadura craniellae]RAY16631.1 mechanosensitive ion channel family protein [Actinomadura craniellae]
MPDPLDWGRVAIAAVVVVAALLIGFVLRAVLRRLTHRAAGTRWAWDDLIVRLVLDLVLVLTVAGSTWAAVRIIEFQHGVQDVIARVLWSLVVLAVSLAVARLAAGVVSSVTLARSGVAQSVSIFANITRTVVIVVGLLVLLQSQGVSVTPLLTALGVGGLAVALALQDTLANLFAGVHILASKTIEPGDFVRLSTGQQGYVVDINWRKTTIRELTDNLVIIPNAKFADAILTNYNVPAPDMGLLLQAKVGYGSDLEQVERVTIEVAEEVMREVEGGVPDHEPLVRFHTFGDSSIDFTVILRTREFEDQFRVRHEFVKRLHLRYRREGIDIPLPVRKLVFDGDPGDVPGMERLGTG